jgi:hypothetical protein
MGQIKSNKSQAGVAHIVLLVLVLAVVSAVILVGVRVMQNQNTGEDSSTSSAPVVNKTPVPSTISSAADLNTAKTALTQDSVDSDLNPDSFNADVSSVL